MNDYLEVDCPEPYVGLEWTEMYSYYGKVVGSFKRSMSFKWQEESPEWVDSLLETYFVIEDTAEKAPYIMTAKEFKKKFSFGQGKGCWVRFRFMKEV
jgi:hypothetical protein